MAEAGLVRLLDLFANCKILEKQKLDQKLHCKMLWFKYMQLQHFINILKVKQALQSPKTSFEQLLASDYLKNSGLLSKLYKILINYNSHVLTLYQKQ